MNPNLFLTLMFFFAGANLWLGSRAAKANKTEDDFFLSGRNLGLGTLVLTILATQLGGGMVIGASEEAYHRGWVILLYPLGGCLGLIVVAMGFGAKLRKMNLCTIPELFETKYGSKKLRKVASGISIISLFIILVAQGIAGKKFFIALGYTEPVIFITFWLILVLYTTMGGLTAVVNTDILQVLFILASFGCAVVWSVFPGVESESVNVSKISFDHSNVPWIGWLFMPFLSMFIEQDIAQRIFAAKTPRLVTKGAFIAAVTIFFVALIPIYFGIKAAEQGVVIPEGSSVLLASVGVFTNPIVTTFISVAIFMAIVSTADTLLCSISSNVAYDFKPLSSNRVVSAKGITFVIGMTALAILYVFGSVIPVLIFSCELSVSLLFVSVIMAAFSKHPRKEGAALSMVAGALSFVIFKVYPIVIPRELMSLAFSAGGYFLGSVQKDISSQNDTAHT